MIERVTDLLYAVSAITAKATIRQYRLSVIDRGRVTALIDLRPGADWRKSRRCEAGSCVEVAFLSEAVAVRDSKVTNGPLLQFPHSEWSAFVKGIRAGDFD